MRPEENDKERMDPQYPPRESVQPCEPGKWCTIVCGGLIGQIFIRTQRARQRNECKYFLPSSNRVKQATLKEFVLDAESGEENRRNKKQRLDAGKQTGSADAYVFYAEKWMTFKIFTQSHFDEMISAHHCAPSTPTTGAAAGGATTPGTTMPTPSHQAPPHDMSQAVAGSAAGAAGFAGAGAASMNGEAAASADAAGSAGAGGAGPSSGGTRATPGTTMPTPSHQAPPHDMSQFLNSIPPAPSTAGAGTAGATAAVGSGAGSAGQGREPAVSGDAAEAVGGGAAGTPRTGGPSAPPAAGREALAGQGSEGPNEPQGTRRGLMFEGTSSGVPPEDGLPDNHRSSSAAPAGASPSSATAAVGAGAGSAGQGREPAASGDAAEAVGGGAAGTPRTGGPSTPPAAGGELLVGQGSEGPNAPQGTRRGLIFGGTSSGGPPEDGLPDSHRSSSAAPEGGIPQQDRDSARVAQRDSCARSRAPDRGDPYQHALRLQLQELEEDEQHVQDTKREKAEADRRKDQASRDLQTAQQTAAAAGQEEERLRASLAAAQERHKQAVQRENTAREREQQEELEKQELESQACEAEAVLIGKKLLFGAIDAARHQFLLPREHSTERFYQRTMTCVLEDGLQRWNSEQLGSKPDVCLGPVGRHRPITGYQDDPRQDPEVLVPDYSILGGRYYLELKKRALLSWYDKLQAKEYAKLTGGWVFIVHWIAQSRHVDVHVLGPQGELKRMLSGQTQDIIK